MQKKITKILVFVIFAVLIIGCDSNWSVRHRDYSFVSEYLNAQGCVGCVVNKLINFQHAEYGIAGGLYIYEFDVSDEEGNKWIVTYTSYKDLDANTVSRINKEIRHNK